MRRSKLNYTTSRIIRPIVGRLVQRLREDYFMPIHVSSTYAHHEEVKIAWHNLWYHVTYRWPSGAQVERGLFHASTCFEHMRSSPGGQNCITQPLVSSKLQVAVWCTAWERTISCLYMFRAHVLIIRRSKLHYTASGIIRPIGGRLVHRLREDYFMPLHVSSTCAHHEEVKIALHSLWYHHTYRCTSGAQVERGPFHAFTCFEHMCSSSGGQNCIMQPLVSSHL